MVEVGTLITVISVLIALGSLVTAVVALNHNKTKSLKEEAKEDVNQRVTMGVLETRLDAIDSGVRDIKADNRSFRNELNKMRDGLRTEIKSVNENALHGVELAEAAHRRLDRIGAAKDIALKE